MARKGKIEIGASVTVGAKEDGSLSKIEKRIEKLSNEEIEINIKDATKHLAELEKMEKMLGKNMAGTIEAQKKQFTDLIEQCKQEQKLRAENLKQIEQEVKAAKELQKVEGKRAKTQKQKTNGPTKREQELADITKSIKGIRGVVNTFDDSKIQKTEEKVRKLIGALDEYQTKLDAMKRLRKGNERTMYDTAKSEIADLKRALGAIQAVKDQAPSIKPKIEKKEKEIEQEKPKKTVTQQPKAPVVGAGDSAKSIQDQTAAIKQQAGAMESLEKSAEKAAKQVGSIFDPVKQKKYTDYINGQIKDTERSIQNQQDWIRHLGWVFDDGRFVSSGKKDAYDKLKLAAMRYNDASRRKTAGISISEDEIELATIAWKKAYDEAVKQGVAERRLYDYKPPMWNYDSSLQRVQGDYDYRKKTLERDEVQLTSLKQIQENIEGFAQLCDILGEYRQCVKDINSEDKVLSGSAAQKLEGIKKNLRVGIDIKDLDKQNALLDIKKKLRADGYSIEQIATDYISRIGFLGGRVNKELETSAQEQETIAIKANTQAIEENIKAKKKQSKIKVRDFTREEYDAAQEKFQQENDGALEDLEETVDIIRQASQFGTNFETQVTTSCKHVTTAVKRFFSAIDPDKYPALAGWKDSILESVQNGYFSDKETYKGMYTGQYSWGVEAIDEDRYYVFLNILDVAKDKEKEYFAYLDEEFRKRDEGLEKESELLAKLHARYAQLNQLHSYNPKWDDNDQITSIKNRLSYYAQERVLLQDIVDLKEELNSIPGMYKSRNTADALRAYAQNLYLGDHGNATLADNERATAVYRAELEAAIERLDERTTPSGQISLFKGMADPVFETVEATNELAGTLKNVEQIAGQISFDEYVKDIKDIVYHAGDLSNIDKTIKSLTLGHVKPQLSGGVYQGKYRPGSIFNGLTGLYTTEDLDSFIGNEWTGAPISSIDISKYKLFKPGSNEIATRVMDFFDELNGTIYGYLEYFDMDQPEMQIKTDVKPIEELYSEMQAIFGQVNVTVEEFIKWVNDSKAAIKGYKFVGREQPVLDEGISKVGYGTVLDGAPDSLINADSFQTQLMKMLGFEGIDLRGTKYNGTYTGGTVIFDIKPESLRAVNEKYSDVMVRNGLYSAEEAKELVEFEEKRRQLAFETAKAFSKTADNSKETEKAFNAVEVMSQGMEARITRANALSQAGIDISRGSLLTNTDEAFKAILGGTSPKDAVQNIVWPMLMEQLKNAGYADYTEFDKMLSGINDKVNWIKSPAPYWYHFGTQNQKFDEKIIRKAYGTFSDIGKLSSEVFTKLLDELVSRGFEGQIKIPRDITGFYNTDQIVGHASNKESFQALVEVFNKFKDSGLLSAVQTGVDANTRVLPFGKNASFTQMIEEIYRSAPGEAFAVNEIRSIINGMVYSNSRKFGAELIQPLIDSVISARVPVIPEQTENINAQERLSQSANEAAEDTERLAETIQNAGNSAERTAEQIEKESKPTQVSNDIINKLTKGTNIEQLLSKYGIPLDKLDTGVDLFKDLAGDIYQGSSGSEGFNRLFDFIATNAERTERVNKTLGEFYEYMSKRQVRIPEEMESTFEAEHPDNWKKIKQIWAINGRKDKKRFITTSKYASTPDVLLEELVSKGFGYALGVDKNFNGSAQDSLRLILDAVQRAKDEAYSGQTQKIIGLNEEEQTMMAADLVQAVGVVEQNYKALSAATNEVNTANNDVIESIERTGEALNNQARGAEDAAKAMEDLQKQEQTDEKSVFSAEKVETEIDRIRKAIHSSEIGLDQIANTDGLQAAVTAYVKSLDEIDDKKFKLISADINEVAEGVDRVTLKFQSLEDENVKLAQTWAMNDGELTLGRLRTTKTFVDSESNFDTELERTVANSKIDALESQLIGIDHVSQKVTDSLTSLRTAAGNISSDSDIKTFAKNFQVAQNYIKEFKNEYKTLGSLANETQNAQAKMANAQETINAQISSSAKYIGVDGYDKVTQSIDNMTSALSKYNEAQQKINDGGLDTEAIGKYEKQMADAFTEYNKAEKQLGAAMKEVRANASFDSFSKSMKDAETVIDTAKLKLDKFGDVDGVDKANGYIDEMTAAWKKFNDTDSTIEDKAQAVKDFTSANESFTKQVQYLNEVQKNTPKESPVNKIQTYYERYVNAVKTLNDVNQQLYTYQGKNESGAYNGFIEQLQEQKARILAELQDINSSVQEEVLNIYDPISLDGDKYKFDLSRYLDADTASTIKEFFNNASVEAELGAESIQKFIDVAMKSSKIDAAFAEGIGKQLKSINDLHESIKEFADTNAEQIFKSIQAGFAAKLTSGTDWTQEQENRLRSLIETYTEYASAIDKAAQKERKILNSVDGKNILRGDSLDPTKDMYDQMVEQAEKMRQATGATAVSIDGFDKATGRLTFTLDGADSKARTFTMSMTELGHVAVAQVKNIDKVKTGWDEFKSGLGGVGKQILQYGLRMVEVYDIIRYLRQGFNEVLEIDTAMTELKKVTDETAVAYDNFAKSAYESSKKIGSTMKEFIQATADFARLGYSLDEASQLAEAANVYKNVGDGINDVAQASESIISTMKAFNIEATDSMGIVDRFNEIGNNFAIDSVGIGEALQRSASALAEAGNSIDESIALVTAANSVVQNPEQVGEMLADYKVA